MSVMFANAFASDVLDDDAGTGEVISEVTKPIKVNEFMEALDVALEYAEAGVGQGK